nr:reverse transcriptase domain-containing protein [Tanacetum cinerariifolium]
MCPGSHRTNPKGTQIKDLTSDVTQGKEGGLTGSPLTRTPKEILATEASKFQPPPPMATPIEKRSSNKFCDFYNDKGHSTDECMQLKKQIEELVRAGKLSHLIKEIKQGREQPKTGKKETAAKDKPMTIYMVRSWQRTVKQKSQMVPATTSLTGFSGETIWPLGKLRLLVIIGDVTNSTKAWMNFMVVKSLSPYNDIIGRPRLKAIQAVPSTVHGMLKFPVEGGIVTICSTILIPTECASLAEADEEKTAFHTGHGVYCYTKMPFGLKNAGATYQRLMDKAFEGQIGQNIEVYVDDLVVKSYMEAEMMRDIEETFRTLRKVNMKLNPKKCSFGLAEGVFLGYVITLEGIKPYPDKTAAVLQFPSLRTVKEVQSLNGKLASIGISLYVTTLTELPFVIIVSYIRVRLDN